jgi:hypothetical protein
MTHTRSLDELYEAICLNVEMGAVGELLQEVTVMKKKDPDWDLDNLPLRPVTRRLIEDVALDIRPSSPAVLNDFGIESQQHYEALYYPLREGEILPMQLEAAICCGPKLTELVNAATSNPHKGISFSTPWDEFLPRLSKPEPLQKETAATKRRGLDLDKG